VVVVVVVLALLAPARIAFLVGGLLLPFPIGLYRGVLRPRIVLSAGGAEIVNGTRQFDVPWSDLAEVTPGYAGTRLLLHDGSVRVAAVGQKSNWAVWRGRRTYADEVAEAVAEAAAHARRGSPKEFLPPPEEARRTRRSTGTSMLWSLVGLGVVTVLRLILEHARHR
jgi:hypothetical protein